MTERAQAEPVGLGVLDAVDVGGTWTVVTDGVAPPPSVTPVERRPHRRLAWAAGAVGALVLVVAALVAHSLPGPRPTAARPPVLPSATDQPGATATPLPVAPTPRRPDGAAPAGQPEPTFTPTPPAPSPSSSPSPSPTAMPAPSPTPTATVVPTPIEVSPTPMPTPSHLPAG